MIRLRITKIGRTGNDHQDDRPWCLRWQTSAMPAPAFWYYETRAQAEHDANQLHEQHNPKGRHHD